MYVSGEEPAKCLRVLTRAATATLVSEEADTINGGEDTRRAWQSVTLMTVRRL